MDNADPLCFAWASIADSGLKYSSPLLVTPLCTTNEGQAFSCQQGVLRTARRLTSYFATQPHRTALWPDAGADWGQKVVLDFLAQSGPPNPVRNTPHHTINDWHISLHYNLSWCIWQIVNHF